MITLSKILEIKYREVINRIENTPFTKNPYYGGIGGKDFKGYVYNKKIDVGDLDLYYYVQTGKKLKKLKIRMLHVKMRDTTDGYLKNMIANTLDKEGNKVGGYYIDMEDYGTFINKNTYSTWLPVDDATTAIRIFSNRVLNKINMKKAKVKKLNDEIDMLQKDIKSMYVEEE